MTHMISRRRAAGVAAAAVAARSLPARGQALDRLVFQTGWLAQAEQGGFYQALATGLYRAHGIDCEIRMGGPQLDVNAMLLSGKADVVLSDGLTAFRYLAENLPFMEIAAIFQKDPRVILAHPGQGIATLADLKGKTILVANSSRNSFWPWMKARFGFMDEQIKPYTFNLAPFLTNPAVSQQGLLTSEPYDMARAGVEPTVFLLADAGFENYQQTLNTSVRMIREKPDLMQRFVDATVLGWVSYLHEDPGPANALIKQANPDMDDGKIAFARDAMVANGLVQSGDAVVLGVGAMTDARWRRFYESMVQVGAVPDGLDVSRAYTTQFVNKKVGLS